MAMRRTFTALIKRDTDTGFYVGFVPALPGAHTQGETLDELNATSRKSSRCFSKTVT